MVQATILSVALALSAGADAAALLDPARLGDEAGPLQVLVDQAAVDGLPAELLVSKIREGLAKNVEPPQIRAAAQRLIDALVRARGFIAQRRPGHPARELLQAVAQAQLAGCGSAELDLLVRTPGAPAPTARAIDVLVDLLLRGYPSGPVARMVGDVLAREPDQVGRLPAMLERLRREQALSPGDVIALLAPARVRVAGLPEELQRRQARERAAGAGGGRLLRANELRSARHQADQARARGR